MKKFLLSLSLIACGSPQQPYYSMNWNCGTDSKCKANMGAQSGSGTFHVESDCLAWETAFLNNYKNVSVSSCVYHE